MRISELEIGGSFEVGYGQWKKVSIRAELSEADNVDECAKQLGAKVDEFLFPKQSQVREVEQSVDEVVNDILSCKTLEELSKFRLISSQNQRLNVAYKAMLEKINHK